MDIIIKNARASYPHLHHKPVFASGEGKYACTAILDKSEQSEQVNAVMAKVRQLEKQVTKGKKLAADKLCFRDGDLTAKPEYEDCWILSASTAMKPVVLNVKAQPVGESDDRIYAGCRINMKVRLWGQDNQWGKRVNAELVAVQFAGDDNPIGPHISEEEALSGFEEIPEPSEEIKAELDAGEIPF